MKTKILSNALVCLLLSGCATMVLPPVKNSLMVPCPDQLEMVPEGTTQLSVTLKTITNNYAEYHLCKEKTNAWIQWYTAQQQIFEKTKK